MTHPALAKMMETYSCRSSLDYQRALREILQEIALLGLWRSKFFEKAAFYGGTALRILYGLDRFSEDLDFSLLQPDPKFDLDPYGRFLEKELKSFGFQVRFEQKQKAIETPIQSAFLKANTLNELLVIKSDPQLLREISSVSVLKIKIEVDTNPPLGFATEPKFLLQPIPFSVRSFCLPDLFAGKMHAILFRKWKNRVKGRDWYDLVWYAAHHPQLHLSHLESRALQSGHWSKNESLGAKDFFDLLNKKIDELDVEKARQEVEPFIKDPRALEVWSRDFFHQLVQRIEPI